MNITITFTPQRKDPIEEIFNELKARCFSERFSLLQEFHHFPQIEFPKIEFPSFDDISDEGLEKTQITVGKFRLEWKGNTTFVATLNRLLKDVEGRTYLSEIGTEEFKQQAAQARKLIKQAASAHDQVRKFRTELSKAITNLNLRERTPDTEKQRRELISIQNGLNSIKLPSELTDASVAAYTDIVEQTLPALKSKFPQSCEHVCCRRQDVVKTEEAGKDVLSPKEPSTPDPDGPAKPQDEQPSLKDEVPSANPNAAPTETPLSKEVSQSPEILSAVEKKEMEVINNLAAAYMNWTFAYRVFLLENSKFVEFYHPLFASREEKWMELDAKGLTAKTLDDLEKLNGEIEEQKCIDEELLAILVDEAANGNQSIASQINGLLKQIELDNDAIVEKLPKNNVPTPSKGLFSLYKNLAQHGKQTRSAQLEKGVREALLAADRYSNGQFLNSLKDDKDFFESSGYSSVAKHYAKTIEQFQSIENVFSQNKNVDDYLKNWNKLLVEFDPQYQLLTKLKAAEQAFQERCQKTAEKLGKIEEIEKSENEKVPSAAANFDPRPPFLSQKATLKNSKEIHAYCSKLTIFNQEIDALLSSG